MMGGRKGRRLRGRVVSFRSESRLGAGAVWCSRLGFGVGYLKRERVRLRGTVRDRVGRGMFGVLRKG
jgi:hypothetical protein